jgi:erythromycin esterase-like protein
MVNELIAKRGPCVSPVAVDRDISKSIAIRHSSSPETFNPMRILISIFFLSMPAAVLCQDSSIGWIDRHAHPLWVDSADVNDFSFLSDELRDRTIVGLGEASHGTHEFYIQKAQVVRHLITKRSYRTVAFETPSYFMDSINIYLNGGTGNLKKMMQNLALYNTREIYDLFEFIRDYNLRHSPEDRVDVWGFDSEEYWHDQLTRDKRMAANIVEYLKERPEKAILWGHNVHLAKDTTMARYDAMGSHLKAAFGSDYYVLFLDTYKGSVNVLNNGEFETHSFKAQASSFSELFARSKYECFFISFVDKPNPFYNVRNLITNIFSIWLKRTALPVKPGVDFDGMIFIRNTRASIRND